MISYKQKFNLTSLTVCFTASNALHFIVHLCCSFHSSKYADEIPEAAVNLA